MPVNHRTISMNSRYLEGLKEFRKRCTDNVTIKQFLTDLFSGDEHGIRKYLGSLPSVRAADIGCGDGTVSAYLAALLKESAKKEIAIEIIEPTETYISSADDKLSMLCDEKLHVRFLKKTAEDHFADLPGEYYDFVLASHSLHLVDSGAVSRIVASIKTGGCLAIVTGAAGSIMSLLKDLFFDTPSATGSDIVRMLCASAESTSCSVKTLSNPSNLDLEDIELAENKNGLSEAAKNLLSLMLQRNIDEIGQSEYAIIRRLILERMDRRLLRLENDCIVFNKGIKT